MIRLMIFVLLSMINPMGINLAFRSQLREVNTIIHKISDENDPLSSDEIIEQRDENGVPVWFYRDFFKQVCTDSTCKMARLRIYWDGAGNYNKFQLIENEPLTKTDHSQFTLADYQKLNMILADTGSILKDLKMDELIVKNEDNRQVDAVTKPTRPSFTQYLVPDAAYTCYTLWHTTYGVTRDSILSFLDQMADANFLKKVLQTNESNKTLWGISFIDRHADFQASFCDSILNLVNAANQTISRKAFDYFLHKQIEVPEIQQKLTSRVELFPRNYQLELVQRLSKMSNIDNGAFLNFINAYIKGQLDAGMLKSVFETTRPTDWNDKDLINSLTLLSTDKNPFVREMVKKLPVVNGKKN